MSLAGATHSFITITSIYDSPTIIVSPSWMLNSSILYATNTLIRTKIPSDVKYSPHIFTNDAQEKPKIVTEE